MTHAPPVQAREYRRGDLGVGGEEWEARACARSMMRRRWRRPRKSRWIRTMASATMASFAPLPCEVRASINAASSVATRATKAASDELLNMDELRPGWSGLAAPLVDTSHAP